MNSIPESPADGDVDLPRRDDDCAPLVGDDDGPDDTGDAPEAAVALAAVPPPRCRPPRTRAPPAPRHSTLPVLRSAPGHPRDAARSFR